MRDFIGHLERRSQPQRVGAAHAPGVRRCGCRRRRVMSKSSIVVAYQLICTESGRFAGFPDAEAWAATWQHHSQLQQLQVAGAGHAAELQCEICRVLNPVLSSLQGHRPGRVRGAVEASVLTIYNRSQIGLKRLELLLLPDDLNRLNVCSRPASRCLLMCWSLKKARCRCWQTRRRQKLTRQGGGIHQRAAETAGGVGPNNRS